MTETDPKAARPKAGTVGVHRQDVSEPVTDPESLNAVRQSQPGPGPVAAARDTETRGAGEERKGHDEIAEVRQEIERTRDDLGDTIEALAAKADVKARAQERVHATTAAARARVAGVTGRVREVTPEPLRGAAGRAGEQAKRRPGLVAGAGAAATALLVLRRISRSQGRTARPGVSGMFQKRPGVSGTAGMPRMRGLGGARRGRGMFGASGRTGMARGGARPFGSGVSGAKSRAGATSMFGAKRGARMFGAGSRAGGMGPLGGKGALGGKRTFGGMSMFGGRRTPGGMSMFGRKGTLGGAGVFGRKSRRGGTGILGMLGRSRMFGGRPMFPRTRRSLMRRFAHR
ncbi:DUF3618 domain-containing protein [Microbispora hainanensis]|uniref:DUF3618 domain-containing protein n=1 Tax=Microbispora hainanensis TaxID=568844 RepID=A0A544Z3F0_9ACTN|nr:DUF3618 domain-containing protein [Microbispora hainanensis]TQS23152.1 DUF3618 domain-containing protein [Microbispora hainanensis]